jgi:hypothetical protein
MDEDTENMVPEKLGHLMVYYRRWKDTKDQVITTYALRKHKDMPEVPYETCRKMVYQHYHYGAYL